MIKEELEKICCIVCKAVTETGEFINGEAGKLNESDIELKGVGNLVSYVDKTAEKMLIDKLSELIPNAAFLVEENSVNDMVADFRWIIDPLDGTTNFIYQLPFYAISIALEEKGKLVIGVVLDIKFGDLFYAWDGGGAYLNGKRINVSQTTDLTNSLVATGFPYYNYDFLDPYLRCFRHFMLTTRGVRRIGSAALDLAYVACGRFDFFFEYSLQKWDVAGGIVLVREAGGHITDLKGEETYYETGSILAGGKDIHEKALEVIAKEF